MSEPRPIRKILVANRGEIAVRVMRSCAEVGISTVAVFSEPDRTAMHVRIADEAYEIGPAASSASYLNAERILNTAIACGADAIHPGYGFLSENASFSAACSERGIIFIGPDPDTISAMGDKTAARALMQEAGVPMAPGTVDPIESEEQALDAAREIGFPVLIKAAAGGGGKGMRIVREEGEFSAAFDMSRSEAGSAFGDNRVFVEKYIEAPRHIEFQVLGDSHGNILHLFERECSIQRRLQKVVEEAPSSVLDPDLRERMGKAAVEAARSCGYTGAGTVEFLLDANHEFYFMEMNTRLQVEHPVTEWITGIDLVIEQIRVAEGHELRWNQNEISMNGHAVECRVYAEDADADFMPAPGHLAHHRAPAGFGVRVDAGVESGDDISIHYDPMISKLITWGRSRDEAIRRMERALDEYEIAGVPTTIGFCRFVMAHEAFRSGDFSTHFVKDHWNADSAPGSNSAPDGASRDPILREALAHLAAHLYREEGPSTASNNGKAGTNAEANGVGSDQWSSEWRRRRNGRRGK